MAGLERGRRVTDLALQLVGDPIKLVVKSVQIKRSIELDRASSEEVRPCCEIGDINVFVGILVPRFVFLTGRKGRIIDLERDLDVKRVGPTRWLDFQADVVRL